ncbi:MAG TPA: hypothetical protein VJ883_07385 [Woeseiaceae bacterium]|nr:hypothetical protein [Woeseiaceae bacterium]
MKRYSATGGGALPALIIAAATLTGPATGDAGLLDKLKDQAGKTLDKALQDTRDNGEEAVNEVVDGKLPDSDVPAAATDSAIDKVADKPSGAPADGQWQGQLSPAGKKSIAAHGSLEITLAGDTRLMRYQGGTSDCVAELEGSEGRYTARFLTGQSLCGRNATVRLGRDGKILLGWDDAPNTKPDEKTYSGMLNRSTHAWPRKHWSLGTGQRRDYDVIDFYLGMSYENARARIRSDPDMSHEWRLISTANGAGTLSPVEIVEKRSGSGAAQASETLSLQFEAQSPAEMKVEQDPAVLARREEIDAMARERAERERAIRAEYSAGSRRVSRARQEDLAARRQAMEDDLEALPEIPEKPPLRPEGAAAELVFIGREIVFPSNARPNIDNVTQALIGKYGPPSVHTDNRLALEWVFTPDGERIADAEGGPCDVVTPAARQDHQGETPYYGLAPRWVSPECGFTLAINLRPQNDGGLYSMRLSAYDQRRLLGDNWYRTVRLTQAIAAKEKAALEATKAVDGPEL